MREVGFVVNSIALLLLSVWCLWSLQRRIRFVVGRRRRPRGSLSLAASPVPSHTTMLTTGATRSTVGSSSSRTPLGSQSAAPETLLRLAAQNRRGAHTYSGAREAGARGPQLPEDAA